MTGGAPQHAPLVEIAGLSVAFPEIDSSKNVVNAFDLRLPRREVTGLVGESGSGKTMLGRSLMGLLPPGATILSGSLLFDGLDLRSVTEKEMRRIRGAEIGMIFQEPTMSLNPSLRIGDQLAEGLRLHSDLDGGGIESRCVDMLRRVRIADPAGALSRYPHEFSGGMLQRIMIASVLLMKPRLLIADEPTTALDVLIQKEVMDILIDVTQELETSILLISHDLGLVANYAHRVAVMRDGNLVESGTVTDILLAPKDSYTKALLHSLPKRTESRKGPHEAGPTEIFLEVKDLSVHFHKPRGAPWRKARAVKAVDGLSIELPREKVTAVVGESGSGKTTLGRAILQLVQAERGEISLRGQNLIEVERKKMRPFRRELQCIFQDPFSSLDPRMRVAQIVGEGLRFQKELSSAERKRTVRNTLAEVGLGAGFENRFPHELSGGQRQRVCIARAIVTRPALIVADEPVSALDVTVQAQILALLKTLQQKFGFTYLFISHDLGVVEQIADNVAVVNRGQVLESGSRNEVFDDPRHPYTCRLLEAAPRLRSRKDGGYTIDDRQITPRAPPDGFLYHNRGIVDHLPTTDRPAQLVQVGKTHYVSCCPSRSQSLNRRRLSSG